MATLLSNAEQGFNQAFNALLNRKQEMSEDIIQKVATIIDDVKTHGDKALFELTEKYDHIDIKQKGLKITKAQMESAYHEIDKDLRSALQQAYERIFDYHKAQKPRNESYKDALGNELGAQWNAVESAGLYVPGGTASYPSSVLMNAVPAKVAGVDRLIMTVPTPKGVINPTVLAAAYMAKIDEIYTIGGAQAIAALAYGTQSIKPVDVIVGPGNAFVAAAKKHVFGHVGIDMVAGPSEVCVIADHSANPNWVAADLLAQAEHDSAAQSIVITTENKIAKAIAKAVDIQLETLPRQDIARKSWQENGAIIKVDTLSQAVTLANKIAAEHLELAIEKPEIIAPQIRNAGAIFMGHYTPETIGDYNGGTNHVLPTARSARFASGLSVYNFMKRTSLLACSQQGFSALADNAILLAQSEGLDGHAKAVRLRKTK